MQGKSILIVEDENIIALDLRDRLLSFGLNVSAILASGEEALKYIREKKVDLILMDINLGGILNGVETTELITQNNEIPIIYITAYSDDEILNRASKTIVYGYITKPISVHELRFNIEMALKRFSFEKEKSNNYRAYNMPQKTYKKIAIWRGDEIALLNPEELLCIEIRRGMLHFHTTKETLFLRGTLSTWEDKLRDYGFYRCHKSFLVNIAKTEKIVHMGDTNYMLKVFVHKELIPIAREKTTILKNLIEI